MGERKPRGAFWDPERAGRWKQGKRGVDGNQGLGLVAGREQWGGSGGQKEKEGVGSGRLVDWSPNPLSWGPSLRPVVGVPRSPLRKKLCLTPHHLLQVSEGPAPFWESSGCQLLKTHACPPSPPDGCPPRGYGSVQDEALSPSQRQGPQGALEPERGLIQWI